MHCSNWKCDPRKPKWGVGVPAKINQVLELLEFSPRLIITTIGWVVGTASSENLHG